MSNMEIVNINRDILILGTNERLIREIGEKTKGLVISDSKTFESVKQARTEIVTLRTSIDKARKTANKTHRDAINDNNNKAEVLTIIISEYEEPLQTQVKNWQDKKSDEKRIKDEAENLRVTAHTDAVNVIRNLPVAYVNASIEDIQGVIEHYLSIEITEDVFEEYAIEARHVLKQSIESMDTMLIAAKLRQAETNRQAEAQTRIDADQKKLDKQREQQEAEARECKKKQDDEKMRLRIQRDELNKKQRESDKKAEQERRRREEKIRSENEEKERQQREEALRPDKEKLIVFADQIRALKGPDVASDDTKYINQCALQLLDRVANIIQQQCNAL